MNGECNHEYKIVDTLEIHADKKSRVYLHIFKCEKCGDEIRPSKKELETHFPNLFSECKQEVT